MATLKERAEEYANSRSDDPSDEVIKAMEVSYLAGAKAMNEMVEAEFLKRHAATADQVEFGNAILNAVRGLIPQE